MKEFSKTRVFRSATTTKKYKGADSGIFVLGEVAFDLFETLFDRQVVQFGNVLHGRFVMRERYCLPSTNAINVAEFVKARSENFELDY